VKTVASENRGVDELLEKIKEIVFQNLQNDRRFWLLADRAYKLIEQKRMKNVDKLALRKEIESLIGNGTFNLYKFVSSISDDV